MTWESLLWLGHVVWQSLEREVTCWVWLSHVRSPWRKDWKWERGSIPGRFSTAGFEDGGRHRAMASKNREWLEINLYQEDKRPQSYNHKELNYVNNLSEAQSRFFISQVSTSSPADTIISALWEPELRTWPCCTWFSHWQNCDIINQYYFK